jgi:hypothetical protein
MTKQGLLFFSLFCVLGPSPVRAGGFDYCLNALIHSGGGSALPGKKTSAVVPAAFPENRWSPRTVHSRREEARAFRQEEVDPGRLPSKVTDAVAHILDLSNEGHGNEHGFFVAELDNGEVMVSDFVTSHEHDGISEQASDAILDKFLTEQAGKEVRLQFFHTHAAWGTAWTDPGSLPQTWSLSRMDVDEALRLQAKVGVPVDMHLVPPELNRQTEVPLHPAPPVGSQPVFDASGRIVPNPPAPAPPPRIITVSPAIMRVSVP